MPKNARWGQRERPLDITKLEIGSIVVLTKTSTSYSPGTKCVIVDIDSLRDVLYCHSLSKMQDGDVAIIEDHVSKFRLAKPSYQLVPSVNSRTRRRKVRAFMQQMRDTAPLEDHNAE